MVLWSLRFWHIRSVCVLRLPIKYGCSQPASGTRTPESPLRSLKKMQITFENFLVSCFFGANASQIYWYVDKNDQFGVKEKKKSLTYKKNPSRESGTRIKVVGQDRNKS